MSGPGFSITCLCLTYGFKVDGQILGQKVTGEEGGVGCGEFDAPKDTEVSDFISKSRYRIKNERCLKHRH